MNDQEKGWNSDDYKEDYRKLSEVSDDGVTFIFTHLSYEHGANKYHAVHGVENGVRVAYLFSSNGLKMLLEDKSASIKGKSIVITPSGTDMERKFDVRPA